MVEPKVLGLNGFGLLVPDLDQADAFYRAFGLDSEKTADVLRVRSPGRSNDEGILVRGAEKRLHHVSFYTDAARIDPFRDRLKRAGLEVREEPPGHWHREGLWFQDPWGTWVNISPNVPSATRPEAGRDEAQEPEAGRARRVDIALWRGLRTGRSPRRIGHMLMFTQDWEAAERFYCETLGMRTSDRASGRITFMAAGEGVTDHHCFGLVNSTHRGFQHASFQVADIDEIGLGAWRMRAAGYKECFGVGRHSLASNLFHYVRDPWGSWIEYYADMDQISPAWVSRDWNELPYVWGPEWSPELWRNEVMGNFESR
jgi:catechol 2,3-dioxygenase-like lactoylglutathione lyase family enzyme